MARIKPEKIAAVVDIITSEHPEYTDIVEVRAAVEMAYAQQPTYLTQEAVKVAVGFLKEMGTAPTESPTDAEATAKAVQNAMAPDEGETPAENEIVTTVTTSETKTAIELPQGLRTEYMAQMQSALESLTYRVAILEQKMDEVHRFLASKPVPGAIPAPPVKEIFYTYVATVNNPALLPEKYKGVDGKPDMAMIHADLNAEGSTHQIPGCLVGKKS